MEQMPTDDYPECTDITEELMSTTIKRRIMDSSGNWHSMEQTKIIFFKFDELLEITSYKNENFSPKNLNRNKNIDVDIDIMDTALEQSRTSKFPLNLCFQNEVLQRSSAAMFARVDAKMKSKKSKSSEE